MWECGRRKLALSTGLECIQPTNKDKTETLICINSNFTCVYDCDDRAFFCIAAATGSPVLLVVETRNVDCHGWCYRKVVVQLVDFSNEIRCEMELQIIQVLVLRCCPHRFELQVFVLYSH